MEDFLLEVGLSAGQCQKGEKPGPILWVGGWWVGGCRAQGKGEVGVLCAGLAPAQIWGVGEQVHVAPEPESPLRAALVRQAHTREEGEAVRSAGREPWRLFPPCCGPRARETGSGIPLLLHLVPVLSAC